MCRLWTYAALCLLSLNAYALRPDGTVVVAVIDTGYTKPKHEFGTRMCAEGHWDFTSSETDQKWTADSLPPDEHGHGTHIAGLIHQAYSDAYLNDMVGAPESDRKALVDKLKGSGKGYCLIILKYYDDKVHGEENLARTISSFRRAIEFNADVVNYSGGGVLKSEEEALAVEDLLRSGAVVVAAAGNEGMDIDFFRYYPASYPGVISVGAYSLGDLPGEHPGRLPKYVHDSAPKGKHARLLSQSNYGRGVDSWERGDNRLSTLPAYMAEHSFGYMSGTSQATAIHSGKLARRIHDIQAFDGRMMCSYPYPKGAK
jgi:subtilisin family serine protease